MDPSGLVKWIIKLNTDSCLIFESERLVTFHVPFIVIKCSSTKQILKFTKFKPKLSDSKHCFTEIFTYGLPFYAQRTVLEILLVIYMRFLLQYWPSF